MAHSIRGPELFSLRLLFSLGHAKRAEQATSSWTSRFLSRLLRASDFDRRESPEGETSYVYPPTYLPYLYTTQSHFVNPASISRTELRHYLNKSFYCVEALTGSFSKFRHIFAVIRCHLTWLTEQCPKLKKHVSCESKYIPGF